MSLRVTCPGCKTVLKVDEKYSGRVLICSQCQHRFRVATSEGSGGKNQRTEAPAPANLPDRAAEQRTTRPAPHWAYIAGGSAGASLLVCMLCWFLFLRPAKPQPTSPALQRAGTREATDRARPAADERPPDDAAAKPPIVAGGTPAGSLPHGASLGATAGTDKWPPSAAASGEEKNRGVAATTSLSPTRTVPPQLPREDQAEDKKILAPAQSDLSAVPLEELIARVGGGVVLIKVLDRSGNPIGLGSGFVIDERGLVATCFHVVRHARRAQVQFRDGFTTEVKGSLQLSPQADLAILELKDKPSHLTVLRLAADEELRLGQEVIAIGHPSGLTFTPTRGIINGVHKTSELPRDARQFLSLQNASKDEQWVQTDAVISPGNSGGPLMNRRGEVVGVNSWVSTETRFAFAVHVKHLEELRRSLYAHAQPLSAIGQNASAADDAPSELENKVDALFGEYQRAAEDFLVELDKLRSSVHTRAELDGLFRRNPANQFAARFLALGKQNRKTKTALQSYFMACYLLRGADPKTTGGVLQQTTELLLQDHLEDRDLGKVALLMPSLPQSGTKGFLRSLIGQTPHRDVRAYACLALAKTLQHEADAKPESSANPAADKEIVSLLKRLTEEFADVTLQGHPIAELVQPLLFAKEHLAVGKKAPEIEGADAEGTEFKLSDYRGKVVLLEFWGDWSASCVRLYPYERILVNKFKGRKFVLLGVNTDSPDRLAAVQNEKKVTWRSWADGSLSGPITKPWGVDSVPTMYLIDHKGTIRMRGSFDPDTIEQAVDLLVAEAEGRSKAGRHGNPAVRRALQSR